MSNYRIVNNGTAVVWEGDTLRQASKELATRNEPHDRIQRNEACCAESIDEWSQLSPVTGQWNIL